MADESSVLQLENAHLLFIRKVSVPPLLYSLLCTPPPYFLNLNFNNLKVGYERSAHAIGFFFKITAKEFQVKLTFTVSSPSPFSLFRPTLGVNNLS